MRRKLTDRMIGGLELKEKRYQVGDSIARGLQLRVSPDGRRTFSAVYRLTATKVRRFTIGEWPAVSLKDARDTAEDLRSHARHGVDDQAAKVEARHALSLAEAAQRFVEAREADLAPSTAGEYKRMVEKVIALSAPGRAPLANIRRADLREWLEEIARDRGPVAANRLFQLVKAVSRWALHEELTETNPADGLKRPRKEKTRERVLSDHEVKLLLEAADQDQRTAVGAAVRCLLLLGTRSAETIEGMRWADLDLEAETATWTIPGAYRKGGRLLLVPLPLPVVRMVEALPRAGERVFHGISEANAERDWWGDVRDRAIAAGAAPFTKHDLRRTCATGCAKLGAAPWVVSMLLGHKKTEGTVAVSGVYNRYEGIKEKREALGKWADHVVALTSAGK
jgi:integrase